MLPTINYNRSTRVYEVLDQTTGEMETFPAKEKLAAEQYAIAMSNPRLVRIIRDELLGKRPFLEARAWKAAALVVDGAVALTDGLYLAYVRGEGDTYAIGSEDGLQTCTCADFTGFGAPIADERGQRLCKHILAYQFMRRLQKRRCYHCSKLVDANAIDCPLCGGVVTPY